MIYSYNCQSYANYIEIAKSVYREHGTRYDYPIYHKHTDICQKLMELEFLTA